MSKSLDANYSEPFKVGDYENYLSKLRLCVCMMAHCAIDDS